MCRCHTASGGQWGQVGLERNSSAKTNKSTIQAGHGNKCIEKLGVTVGCFSAEGDLLN